jgi:hypothetical protein
VIDLLVTALYFIGLPYGSAFLACRLDDRGRVALTWGVMTAVAFAVAGIGFAAHKFGLLGSEGSGMTPITIGIVVPLTATLIVGLAHSLRPWIRVTIATAIGATLVIPLAVVSHYGLSQMVPSYFGCCPL